MRFFTFILVMLSVAASAAAQSGRIGASATPQTAAAGTELSVKQLFEEANEYTKTKFAAFFEKNVPYNEALARQTLSEQKHLAAKNAAIAGKRTDLAGEDLYYLGMLHWLADNQDGATEAMSRFLKTDAPAAEKAQTARSIIAVVAAAQKRYDEAEALLAEYVKQEPTKLSERIRMESQLAESYKKDANFAKMAPHADQAFTAARASMADMSTRPRSVDDVLNAGIQAFDAAVGLDDRKKAEDTLDQLRLISIQVASPSVYYYVIDKKIKYLIETGRKPAALELYRTSLADIPKDFSTPDQQTAALNRLTKREEQYKLLGEAAPELPPVEQWFPGRPQKIGDLKGKVVLLDFWAMWCGPCLEAFPAIHEMYADLHEQGLEVFGVTRYYGAEVDAKDDPTEIAMLKTFSKAHAMSYDQIVSRGQEFQSVYAAWSLPTTVIIDRKGIIRYIDSGTSPTRLAEIRATIVKLLAEK